MTATISFEIELTLEGTVVPFREATRIDPAEGGYVEDVEITDVGLIELVQAPVAERGSHPRGIWKTTSLFEGVNINSPDIQRLLSNILGMKEAEAQEAIMEDAE